MTITTCIFDAYGTLFDVNSSARRAATEPGQERLAAVWPQLAKDWRQKQLEYSWLRAVADRHCDFWQVTQDGLDWAMEAANLDDPALRERLLALYWKLEAYPEVPAMLRTLKDRGLTTAILSNGTPDMLRAAITRAGLNDLLDDALSVEDVSVFKPHEKVYDMVGNRFGCRRDQVMFVSSNGWDAAGAADYGFHTVWANRLGAPIDRLYARPEHVLTDLSTLPDFV
jgi:2-haloacid dehalogenase